MNIENSTLNRFREVLLNLDDKRKKKRSFDTFLEIQKYMCKFYNLFELFKPSEFRLKLEENSYSISSARLSQILKSLVESGYLKKEEKARYKIIKLPPKEEI